MTNQKPPTSTIVSQQERLRRTLPFDDVQDFEDAHRGFIGKLDPCVIRDENGEVVWDNESYNFINGEAPDSVNPSLWRQSTLNTIQGLFQVTDGIYQVRGFDLSVISFIESDTGIIVIDPLVTQETAAAALALYREHRGPREVRAVIYTHSHVDHFGGVKGVTTQEDVDAGRVPIIAPEGFLKAAIAENVYAGTAMNRRAGYMQGAALERGPRGQVGTGLGQTVPTGQITLIPPTLDITHTGQEEVVDGVRIIFQLAPDSEAPAEMHFMFPDFRALCMAENATHNLHNILTLRGALVRDANMWAQYLTDAIDLFVDQVDVSFASHHWPTWGQDRIREYLSIQRDLYAYLHDQTLRMMNQGMVGAEIAEAMVMPPVLERAWHTHGYYGSVSHCVKAIYQRYLGWFSGNPATLWEHIPVERAMRYVDFMGGADAVVEKARTAFDDGDFRWVAEVVNHVVFADPTHAGARELLADAYEQLGYGAENGTWRNFYLSGVTELRQGSFGTPTSSVVPDVLANLSPSMIFDALAIQINGPRAWDEHLSVNVALSDIGQTYRLELRNGVLTHHEHGGDETADVTLTLVRSALPALVLGAGDPEALARLGVEVKGDESVLGRLVAVLDPGDPDFAIVTADKE